jgi:hypothetical protein
VLCQLIRLDAGTRFRSHKTDPAKGAQMPPNDWHRQMQLL